MRKEYDFSSQGSDQSGGKKVNDIGQRQEIRTKQMPCGGGGGLDVKKGPNAGG